MLVAHIVVMGAGIAGMPAAYDLRSHLGKGTSDHTDQFN